MLPTLDERLSAAAALVRPGQPVADIACDHGKLAAVLAASGLYPRVIAADLRPGPLAKAQKTLQNAGCAQMVELRLGDGLSVLAPGEVGTVVLAGVSAQTTVDILSAAPWIFDRGGPRLVLVPATRHAELRRWLLSNGFDLVQDRPVQAAGRWYAVMAAEYTGHRSLPTLEDCLYGKTLAWPGGEAYAALERAKLKKYRLGVENGTPLADEIDALLARDEKQERASF
jgi:tRNA (adenine22-N1)-methyltransferase